MGKLYLIRHALPDFPPGTRRCVGITDVPLGTLGELQALVLGEYMKAVPLQAVFCSDLSRAIRTASAISPNPIIVPELREMNAGDWDGLFFDEIRQRWPEVYEKRGIDPNYPIPGAELPEQGQRRFRDALEAILRQTQGDIAIVSHCTVMQSFLSFVLGTDVNQCRQYRLDYTGITTVGYENGKFTLERMNERPRVPLSDGLCEKLLVTAKAPLDHCREVCEKADAIIRALSDAGMELNKEVIHFGALLHDIAKKEPDHPAEGAAWLRDLGWEAVADTVRTHHDPENAEISEQNIVYLADKLPVEERFARSLVYCTTLEGRNAHARRLLAARQLKVKINALCGKDIVP